MTMRVVCLLDRLMNDLDQHVKRRLYNNIVVAARLPVSGAAPVCVGLACQGFYRDNSPTRIRGNFDNINPGIP